MDEAKARDDDLPEQVRVRLAKRERMLADGLQPYPVTVPRTATLAQVRRRYELAALQPDTTTGDVVAVAGRVIHLRNTGKLCFAQLREGDGTELQVMLSRAEIGAAALESFKDLVDLGDHLSVDGEVITSRRGELSVLATSWHLASKALRPLPVDHKELSDEARVRQRYLDLVLRPEAREMVRAKATVLASLRRTLADRDFLEVETPVLQLTNGGAAARPFRTHLNAFDQDMLLRIALELDLKRALVGGVDRVEAQLVGQLDGSQRLLQGVVGQHRVTELHRISSFAWTPVSCRICWSWAATSRASPSGTCVECRSGRASSR